LRYNLEIIAALGSVLLVTAAYGLASVFVPVGPSSLVGHAIGILGFALMIATETLYTWRKTRQRAVWGRTQIWLAVHIYTGIVGPYMVLLHTGFRFAGLAGISFWLTVVVVSSGFVGRYIYTAIPRSALGDEIESGQLERAIHQAERELDAWLSTHAASLRALVAETGGAPTIRGWGPLALWRERRADRRRRQQWARAVASLDRPALEQARELAALLERRLALRRQARRAASARRLLVIWHAAHVPLAVALFVTAIVHMVAALYYS
jgi:hypothetical protein